jgi:hypothetical protein
MAHPLLKTRLRALLRGLPGQSSLGSRPIDHSIAFPLIRRFLARLSSLLR